MAILSPSDARQRAANLSSMEPPPAFLALINEMLLSACVNNKENIAVNFEEMHVKLINANSLVTMLSPDEVFLIQKMSVAKVIREGGWVVDITDYGWLISFPEADSAPTPPKKVHALKLASNVSRPFESGNHRIDLTTKYIRDPEKE